MTYEKANHIIGDISWVYNGERITAQDRNECMAADNRYNLCRINMFLHDIEPDKFDIACEDTLLSPQH